MVYACVCVHILVCGYARACLNVLECMWFPDKLYCIVDTQYMIYEDF